MYPTVFSIFIYYLKKEHAKRTYIDALDELFKKVNVSSYFVVDFNRYSSSMHLHMTRVCFSLLLTTKIEKNLPI